MLLVELTVGGVVRYLSNQFLDIEHFYEARIASLSELRIATRQLWGGYAEPSYGAIGLLPSVFEGAGNWPPPRSCAIKVRLGLTGEADAQTLFEGSAYLTSVGWTRIAYDLYGPKFEQKVKDQAYQGTLRDIFAVACVTLGLTLDEVSSRVPSPQVDYTVDGEHLLIDVLSDMAAFFTHKFTIMGGVLTLVDSYDDYGIPILALTEFDVFPSSPLTTTSPVKAFLAGYVGTVSQYRFVFNDTQGDIGSVAIAEMQLKLDGNGDDQCVGGYATAGNSVSGQPPASAVDDVATTAWCGLTGSDCWWQYGFAEAKKITNYSVQAGWASLEQAPTGWQVQGYENGDASWRKIADFTTEGDWEASEVRSFSLQEPKWDVSVAGSYAFGEEMRISPVCQTEYTQIMLALARIRAKYESHRIQLQKPLAGVPKMGQKLFYRDESLMVGTGVWARVCAVVWDFDNERCLIEGDAVAGVLEGEGIDGDSVRMGGETVSLNTDAGVNW